eukprot:2830290-Amphidinium_carterae.1
MPFKQKEHKKFQEHRYTRKVEQHVFSSLLRFADTDRVLEDPRVRQLQDDGKLLWPASTDSLIHLDRQLGSVSSPPTAPTIAPTRYPSRPPKQLEIIHFHRIAVSY